MMSPSFNVNSQICVFFVCVFFDDNHYSIAGLTYLSLGFSECARIHKLVSLRKVFFKFKLGFFCFTFFTRS